MSVVAARMAAAASRSAVFLLSGEAVASCRAAARAATPRAFISATRTLSNALPPGEGRVRVPSVCSGRGGEPRATPALRPSPASGRGGNPAARLVSTILSPCQDEIVAMDDLVAATVAEDGCDFTAFVPGNPADIVARIGGEAARRLVAVARAHNDGIAAFERSLDGNDAGRQQALAAPQRCPGTVIDGQHADRVERPGDPSLARGKRFGGRDEPRRRGAVSDGGERTERFSHRDHHAAASGHGDARGGQLGHHATRAVARQGMPRHRFDLRRQLAYFRDKAGSHVPAWVGGIEPVNVGEQHQRVGAYHLGDPRSEAVVVTETNLRSCHRVVLVDDGNGAEGEKLVQRRARVEVTAALLGVVGGEQYLRDGDAVLGEGFLVGVRQANLTSGGGGLLLLELEGGADEAEMAAADGDGAGGDDENILTAGAAAREILHERLEPAAADIAARLVDEEGGTDLDDQPARGSEGLRRCAFSRSVRPSRRAF